MRKKKWKAGTAEKQAEHAKSRATQQEVHQAALNAAWQFVHGDVPVAPPSVNDVSAPISDAHPDRG